MMLLPATDALERCKERDAPELSADPVQFGMGALYDQALALDMPFVQTFPIIAWPESWSNVECIKTDAEAVARKQKTKKPLRKHIRRSKHRMVRSKSQYKGLCGLGSPPVSLRM